MLWKCSFNPEPQATATLLKAIACGFGLNEFKYEG
jgi:hypothetical protein